MFVRLVPGTLGYLPETKGGAVASSHIKRHVLSWSTSVTLRCLPIARFHSLVVPDSSMFSWVSGAARTKQLRWVRATAGALSEPILVPLSF